MSKWLLAVSLLGLGGCGSSDPSPVPSPSPTPPLVRADQSFLGAGYGCISNPDGTYPVSVHLVEGATGALGLHPEGLPSTGGVVSAVAMGPLRAGRRFLYAGLTLSPPTSHAVDTYRIDGDGRLTRLGTRAGQDDYAAELTADPQGRFVFVALDGTREAQRGLVRIHPHLVTEEGFPRRVDPPIDVPFQSIGGVAIDPGGRVLYVVSPANAGLAAYAIDPTRGVLQPVAGSPFRGDPSRAITMHPSGRFLFTVEEGRRRIRTHLLVPDSGVPVAAFTTGYGGFGTELLAEPGGRFLYLVDLVGNRLFAWVILESGALSEIPGSPFATGPGPFSLASDALGRFLYVGTQPNPYGPLVGVGAQIWGHRIDPASGVLSLLPGFPYRPPTPSCPLRLTPGG